MNVNGNCVPSVAYEAGFGSGDHCPSGSGDDGDMAMLAPNAG